jgi:hypothetical protein
LGVVDAFDLDRQRQLVLVRRDNVEHLILIGGPNDLLVETAIIRLQPALSVPTAREKDNAVAAPLAPMGPAFGQHQQNLEVPPPVPAPMLQTPSEPAFTAEPPVQPPAPPEVAAPILDGINFERQHGRDQPAPAKPAAGPSNEMPRPPATPTARPPAYPVRTPAASSAPAGTAAPTTPPVPPASPAATGATPTPRSPFSSFRSTSAGSTSSSRPLSTGPRPTPSAPLTRGTSAASLRRDPPPIQPTNPVAEPPEGNAPPVAPEQRATAQQSEPTPQAPHEAAVPAPGPLPLPAAAPQPEPPPAQVDKPAPLPTTLDTLESLEEEMAKLLGRPTGQK